MKILNLSISLFLVVLAVDLLGLYYLGAWGDTPFIEVVEIFALYCLTMLGIAGFIINLKGLKSEQ